MQTHTKFFSTFFIYSHYKREMHKNDKIIEAERCSRCYNINMFCCLIVSIKSSLLALLPIKHTPNIALKAPAARSKYLFNTIIILFFFFLVLLFFFFLIVGFLVSWVCFFYIFFLDFRKFCFCRSFIVIIKYIYKFLPQERLLS